MVLMYSSKNEEEQLGDEINKIITCKHRSNKISIEQAYKCCHIVRSIEVILESIPKERLPHIVLKRVVYAEFEKLEKEDVLNLNVKKRGAMVNYYCVNLRSSRNQYHV